jgi:hypothetical protein
VIIAVLICPSCSTKTDDLADVYKLHSFSSYSFGEYCQEVEIDLKNPTNTLLGIELIKIGSFRITVGGYG